MLIITKIRITDQILFNQNCYFTITVTITYNFVKIKILYIKFAKNILYSHKHKQ